MEEQALSLHSRCDVRYSVDDESDIAPEEFFTFYEKYRKDNPFAQPDLRRINPYTGKLIKTQADYAEYLREHAYHILCDKKAQELLTIQKDAAEQKLAEQKALASHLLAVQKTANNKKLIQTRARYRKIIAVLILLLVAAVVSALFLSGRYSQGVSDGERSGYDSGYSEGYASGKNIGYQAGYSEGYSTGEQDGYDTGYNIGYYANKWKTDTGTKSGSSSGTGTPRADPIADTYIGNKNSHKFHLPTCSWLPDEKNQVILESRDDAIAKGYVPCQRCNP